MTGVTDPAGGLVSDACHPTGPSARNRAVDPEPPWSASRTRVTSSKYRSLSRVASFRGWGRSMSTTSLIRPGRALMTTTRVLRKTASGMEWVTNSTVVPVRAQILEYLGVETLPSHLVERAEGLVHEQQRRLEHERPGDGHSLLHATRELVRIVLDEVGQADQVQLLLGPLPLFGARGAHDLERQAHVGLDLRQSKSTGA